MGASLPFSSLGQTKTYLAPLQIAIQTREALHIVVLWSQELLVRMLAVPVDDSMVYAELNKSGVCLGMTGVGRRGMVLDLFIAVLQHCNQIT